MGARGDIEVAIEPIGHERNDEQWNPAETDVEKETIDIDRVNPAADEREACNNPGDRPADFLWRRQ